MIIRELQKGDINKGLFELINSFWYTEELTEEMIDKCTGKVYVIDNNDEIIGIAVLHLQHKLFRSGGVAALIEDLCIKEEYRGRGLGKKLITIISQDAKNMGCYKVVLSCKENLVGFYEDMGFEKEMIGVRLNIK